MFEVFKPQSIRFQSKTNKLGDYCSKLYVVAQAKTIKNSKPWDLEGRIKFSKIEDNSYYDWYQKGYNEFHEEHPDLKDKVTINSQSVMEDSIEQGLMYYVYVDDSLAGLISAEREDFLGHSGMYFGEIFLTKEYKRKGFGQALQRKFISEFAIST
ncbi:MAG: GNAT family N-acetyltransferase [Bacteriovoracaceae bacterium]